MASATITASHGGQDLTLHTFFNSSAAYRVRIALGLKGLAWEHVGVNIRTGIQRGPEYLSINPTGLVPTLTIHGQDGDQQLTQSLAIIDYLDRLKPEPRLIPQASSVRGRVLEIALTVACDIHPVNNLRILKYLTGPLALSEAQKNAWMVHWVQQGFEAIEKMVPDHDGWCVGDSPTLADCCLIPQMANVSRFPSFDMTPFPRIQRITAFALKHPAFSDAAPAKQPDFVSP